MPSRLRPLACAAVATLALAVIATSASAQSTGYVEDPETVVLRYTILHGEIAASAGAPSLVIYGDGRARVHYPAYMKRSGDRDVQLSRDEVSELLNRLDAAGVVDVDPRALRAEVRAAAQEAQVGVTRADGIQEIGSVEYVADAPVIVLEMNVVRGQGAAAKALRKVIRWQNLQGDARRFKNIAVIQGLAEAENRLTAIMERSTDGPGNERRSR
jgi:hypothetical protein